MGCIGVQVGEGGCHETVETAAEGVQVVDLHLVKDADERTDRNGAHTSHETLGLVGLLPPGVGAVRVECERGAENDSLIAGVDLVNFSTKVGEFVVINGERPMRLLIVSLNKDTLEGLLLTSESSIVVVIDSLNLIP